MLRTDTEGPNRMGKEERKEKNWLVRDDREELAIKFPKWRLTGLDVARKSEQPF